MLRWFFFFFSWITYSLKFITTHKYTKEIQRQSKQRHTRDCWASPSRSWVTTTQPGMEGMGMDPQALQTSAHKAKLWILKLQHLASIVTCTKSHTNFLLDIHVKRAVGCKYFSGTLAHCISGIVFISIMNVMYSPRQANEWTLSLYYNDHEHGQAMIWKISLSLSLSLSYPWKKVRSS